ncbi:MAG: hypothetical protein ACPGC6_06155 [Flavobacteriaceae bacterium]
MKPIITHLGIAFFFYFFIGCEDPLYNSTSNNHFRVGGKTTVISSAALVKLSGNNLLNDMKALLLASDGITFTAKDEKALQIKGKGQLLGFIIHSNSTNDLTNGDHYVNLRPPFKEGDIAIGFYTMNWDESKGIVFFEKTIGPSLLAGKVTVLQKKDVISLSFNFTDEDQNIVSGVYNGPLQKNLIYKTDHIDLEN